jgi:hypothetical protein
LFVIDLEEGVKQLRLEEREVNPFSVETQRQLLSQVWPLLPKQAFSQPNSPLPNINRSVRLGKNPLFITITTWFSTKLISSFHRIKNFLQSIFL